MRPEPRAPIEMLLIERRGGCLAAGLVRGGRLDDLVLLPVGSPLAPGTVVAGRVARVETALGAAFIDVGTREHALLRARDLAPPQDNPSEGGGPRALNRRLHEGQMLAVQVVHPGYDDKGPRVIGRIGAGASGAALQAAAAARAPGAVLQAADPLVQVARAIGSTEPREIVVADTLARLQVVQAWQAAGRDAPAITVDPDNRPLTRCDALGDIAAALSREVPLPQGGRLSFDQTRALLAVDVDSGAGTRDTAATNLAAVSEIARQLRIRNGAGVIIIDFIDIRPDGQGGAIEVAMRSATAGDRAGVRHAGFGPLGLYELVRNRLGASLAALWPPASQPEGPTPDGPA